MSLSKISQTSRGIKATINQYQEKRCRIMVGKIFVVLIILSASVNAYKNFTKQTISKDSEGGYGVKYSASEQLSNAIKADEQFKKSCKSLGMMRENQCLKNEKEFSDCLKIEEFLLKEKFEIALYKCISKNTPQ